MTHKSSPPRCTCPCGCLIELKRAQGRLDGRCTACASGGHRVRRTGERGEKTANPDGVLPGQETLFGVEG